jgi:hypothetical protein
MRFLSTVALITGVMLSAGPRTGAGQRSHIGPQGGYNFDLDRAFVGAHVLLPVGRTVELYPAFDYYFVDSGSLVDFSGDLKVRVPSRGPSVLYFGAGVDVLRAAAGGSSNTDTGWNFLFGLESRIGATHPFVEGRVLNHDGSAFQAGVGVNLTLF